MNVMPSIKKRKPALHLDLESLTAASNPLSHLTATRGSTNEMDTTLMDEHSIVSTTTPSPSALGLYRVPSEESQPKNVFVVKVCEQLHYAFYLLTKFNRIQIPSSLASTVRLIPPQKGLGIKRLLPLANPVFSPSAPFYTLSLLQPMLVFKPTWKALLPTHLHLAA